MMENKEEFISTLETALIMYSRENIARLEYCRIGENIKGDPAIEEIIIHFGNGYIKVIDITADSCIAIMKDLARALT
jgi:hypothetical protein